MLSESRQGGSAALFGMDSGPLTQDPFGPQGVGSSGQLSQDLPMLSMAKWPYRASLGKSLASGTLGVKRVVCGNNSVRRACSASEA